MRHRTFFYFCAFFICTTISRGQTWDLTDTMTATLDDKGVLTVTTTAESEDMPNEEWFAMIEQHRLDIHSVVIGENVTSIVSWGFAHCVMLKSVTMANSVKIIESFAFHNCNQLTDITLSDGLITIGDLAFNICVNLPVLEIPASVSHIGTLIFAVCEQLTSIHVHPDNANYSSVDGVLYDKDKTLLIQYPENKSGDSFEIPKTVETIAGSACYHANFKTLIIPNSVKTISSNAFNGCVNLTALTIPGSVELIYGFAFGACTGLKDLTVEWNTPLSVEADNIFDKVDLSTTILHVPNGTKTRYEAADVWKDFGTIIEYEPSGIETIETQTLKVYASNSILHVAGLRTGALLRIYSIAGLLVYQGIAKAEVEYIPLSTIGIYIVTDGRETTKFVVGTGQTH
ncbi:MAG: leucine-rich repeat domain-containing protein [Tannerella sp.]|jgi:hypothetical protein|nr:leucine-rich repeat domain-containing protein [Tannerella sp.]